MSIVSSSIQIASCHHPFLHTMGEKNSLEVSSCTDHARFSIFDVVHRRTLKSLGMTWRLAIISLPMTETAMPFLLRRRYKLNLAHFISQA